MIRVKTAIIVIPLNNSTTTARKDVEYLKVEQKVAWQTINVTYKFFNVQLEAGEM